MGQTPQKTPSGDHFHLKTAGISPPTLVSRPSSPAGPQPSNAGARTTRPSTPSSLTGQGVLNDRTHPAQDFRPPSQRPPHSRRARRLGVPNLRLSSPAPRAGFQRGAAAPLWSFQGGLGGNTKSPQNFSSGVWGCILSIRKEYIPRCRQASLAPPGPPASPRSGAASLRSSSEPSSPPNGRALPAPTWGQKLPGFPGTPQPPAPPRRGERSPHAASHPLRAPLRPLPPA